MAQPFEVTVDVSRGIEFPKRCVVCGDSCDSTAKVASTPVGSARALFRCVELDVNIHDSCTRSFFRRDIRRRRVLFVLAGLGAVTAGYLCWGWSGLAFDLAIGFVVAVLLIPAVVWQRSRPLPIEFMKTGSSFQFAFADGEYAEEFADLNGSEVRR